MKKLLVILVFVFPSLVNAFSKDLHDEIAKGEPEWMKMQITTDLNHFQNRIISLREIDEFIAKKPDLLLIKYTIKNNKISVTQNFPISIRTEALRDALVELSETISLPDTVFVMSAHDSVSYVDENVPLFAMSKRQDSKNVVLLPDYEALKESYQVLKKTGTKYV